MNFLRLYKEMLILLLLLLLEIGLYIATVVDAVGYIAPVQPERHLYSFLLSVLFFVVYGLFAAFFRKRQRVITGLLIVTGLWILASVISWGKIDLSPYPLTALLYIILISPFSGLSFVFSQGMAFNTAVTVICLLALAYEIYWFCKNRKAKRSAGIMAASKDKRNKAVSIVLISSCFLSSLFNFYWYMLKFYCQNKVSPGEVGMCLSCIFLLSYLVFLAVYSNTVRKKRILLVFLVLIVAALIAYWTPVIFQLETEYRLLITLLTVSPLHGLNFFTDAEVPAIANRQFDLSYTVILSILFLLTLLAYFRNAFQIKIEGDKK